jgi:hypothetical protein
VNRLYTDAIRRDPSTHDNAYRNYQRVRFFLVRIDVFSILNCDESKYLSLWTAIKPGKIFLSSFANRRNLSGAICVRDLSSRRKTGTKPDKPSGEKFSQYKSDR